MARPSLISGAAIPRRLLAGALLLPPLALFLAFFVGPLVYLFWVSLHSASQTALYGHQLTLEHYAQAFTDPFYLLIIRRTLLAAGAILGLCLVLGYATAYLIAPLPPRRRLWFLLLLLFPLMVSNVVRAYGWITILGRQGVINTLFRGLGISDAPLPLLYSFGAVAFGLMTILLPYMIISITNNLAAMERQYHEAAQSLGANPFRAFIHVILPLSSPGIASGMLLVFLLTMSAYVTATLLGGPRAKILVSLVYDSVTVFEWPRAAALAFVLLLLALAIAGLILLVLRPGRVQGRG
ncbi:MAG TPA: ABC transporter permease [Alphaproteobacteria bacterium]|nr:ABC transporter permease [Alphaproteobacteria bacterium]